MDAPVNVDLDLDVWLEATQPTAEIIEAPMSNLETTLREFVAQIEVNGIKQHTQEWESVRCFLVGGSSIATFTGGGYSTVVDFVYEKLGLGARYNFGSYSKVIYLNWGNLFEPMTEKVVEKELACKIYGENIFVEGQRKDGVLYTGYSPDGLAVVNNRICLLEFKCPFSRMPTRTGIPKMYKPQVKMGLDIIQVAEQGIFVDAIYRKCATVDLNFGRVYDDSMKQQIPETPCKAVGVISFACDEHRRAGVIAQHHTGRKTKLIGQLEVRFLPLQDAGCMSAADFEVLMLQYSHGILEPVYSDIWWREEDIDVESHNVKFASYCRAVHKDQSARLTWKLFQTQYSQVLREANYMEPFMVSIINTMNLIRECYDKDEATKRKLVNDWHTATYPVKGVHRIIDPEAPSAGS